MMKQSRSKILFIALFLVVTLSFACASLSQNKSGEVVRLGNPSADDEKKGRALNVWDMQAFDGKIYLGSGSVADNAGPIKIWAYSPAEKDFIHEHTVPEEAIEHFQVIDNELYIPAADPRGNDANKYYRRTVGRMWQKYGSKDVKLAHVRDIIKPDSDRSDLLMVGNWRTSKKTKKQPPGAAITTDDGATFKEVPIVGIPQTNSSDPEVNVIFFDFSWFLSVFTFDNKIYALNSLLRDTGELKGSIAIYDREKQQLELQMDLGAAEFIPTDNLDRENGKYGVETIYHPWNIKEYNNSLVYTVKSFVNVDIDGSIKKNYLNSLGFYVKESMGKAPIEIQLKNNALGEDLLVIDDELYVLANQKRGEEDFVIYVFKTDNHQDPKSWDEILSFESTNRARSFEYLDDTFYFGLGQDYGEAIANSGDILSYTLP